MLVWRVDRFVDPSNWGITPKLDKPWWVWAVELEFTFMRVDMLGVKAGEGQVRLGFLTGSA